MPGHDEYFVSDVVGLANLRLEPSPNDHDAWAASGRLATQAPERCTRQPGRVVAIGEDTRQQPRCASTSRGGSGKAASRRRSKQRRESSNRRSSIDRSECCRRRTLRCQPPLQRHQVCRSCQKRRNGWRSQQRYENRPAHVSSSYRVTDNGVGIPERDRSRRFERFFRAHHETLPAVHGTGLGLIIIRETAR